MSLDKQLDKKTMQWALDSISSIGITLLKNDPESVQITPWSHVVRFKTTVGYIYLKQTPKAIAIESSVIKILHDRYNVPVAQVISENNQLCCFLMKDAGIKLLDAMKLKFDVTVMCNAVNIFAELQVSVAKKPKVLIDAVIPDWRLERFQDLYIEFIAQQDLLLEDGLTASELKALSQLTPWIIDVANELLEFSVDQTLLQPDFNVNNILIDENTGKFTVIDLGEIVISHPFFSIINFLYQIQKYNLVTENDPAYVKIRGRYFDNFRQNGSIQHLTECLSLAEQLSHVYVALAQYRLIIACGKDKMMRVQKGKLSKSLRALLELKKVDF